MSGSLPIALAGKAAQFTTTKTDQTYKIHLLHRRCQLCCISTHKVCVSYKALMGSGCGLSRDQNSMPASIGVYHVQYAN